jgi:hypothetical protein
MAAVISCGRIIQDVGKNQEVPGPGSVGSLQMTLINFN